MHLKSSIKIKILKYSSVNNPSESSNFYLLCKSKPLNSYSSESRQIIVWARHLITNGNSKYPNIRGILSIGWQLVPPTMLLPYPIYKTSEWVFYIIPKPTGWKWSIASIGGLITSREQAILIQLSFTNYSCPNFSSPRNVWLGLWFRKAGRGGAKDI